MKAETVVLAVKSTGGITLKEITVRVGQFIDLKLHEGELVALDRVEVLHGPGRFQLENRGEAGVCIQVEKGGTK